MAETKSRPTGASVDDFLAAVPDSQRREDARALREMMERVSALTAYMFGPTIVGFGTYRYDYASGHGGEAPRIGFSPRGRELVLYISPKLLADAGRTARLGKVRTGKSCLYVKRLADIDVRELEILVEQSLAETDKAYPQAS